MIQGRTWLVVVSVLLCTGLLQAQETKPTLRYEGSPTIAKFIEDAERAYDKAEFRINSAGKSDDGEGAIIDGLTDIAGIARAPEADVLEKGVLSTLIGWDAIAVVINEKNPVSNLTQAELKDIFTGKIRNWQDLGGPDMEIHPYIVGFESATRNVFRSLVLGESEYVNCKVASPNVNILVEVKNDPGAIGQISFSFLSPNKYVKPIAIDGQEPLLSNRNYPIARPLYLLWWNRKRVKDFIDWTISPEGQTVVQRRFITAAEDMEALTSPPTIKYVGSSTVGIFIQNASSVYREATFQVETDVESSGGEEAIVNGNTDLAGIAKLPKPGTLESGVVSNLIARDAIAVIVPGSNTISNLSLAELKAIFTGQITNWKELGGNDLDIQPYVVGSGSATSNVFREQVLGGEAYSRCREIRPDPAIIDSVAKNPGAIGHISNAFINRTDNVHIVPIEGQSPGRTNLNYPISRPLYLLFREDNAVVQNFIIWTQTNEAQQIIMQHFIGVRLATTSTGIQQTGTLVVFTETSPVEDGGIYFYPHLPYDIYSTDGELIKSIHNSLSSIDESPTQVDLDPGNYLIKTKSLHGPDREFFVNIEANKITRVNTEEIDQTGAVDMIKVLDASEERKRQIADVVGRYKSLLLYGDFRLRGEADWNSQRSDGTFRDDRTRLRFKLRFGFEYNWSDQISFGVRLRSGDPRDQQSPHSTLGKGFETPNFKIDKAFIRGNHKHFWWWGGKNNFPFWKQNELFWDDDVNPDGLAFGSNIKLSERVNFKPTASYFIVYSNGQKFNTDASFSALQLAFDFGLDQIGITAASGYYRLNDIPIQSDGPGIGLLSYQFITSGVKVALKTRIPITVGADLMVNFEDYSNDSLITASGLESDKTGFVASLSIGKLQKKGDILFVYYYAYIQKYSVVDYFAQDDWVRWSYENTSGTRSSNFKGHEFRLAYAFGSGFNVMTRLYLVDAIKKNHPEDVSRESGNRFRIDFNIKF
ncbi:MAG: hypothetical protein DRI69_02125 [Bacteroidetes bacterium]|nr:MAG: hypothetical protein DRI69_02125 [Bacteroidota bacterium]